MRRGGLALVVLVVEYAAMGVEGDDVGVGQLALALAGGPRAVGDLVNELQVAQPRISEHLATLRAANLVVGEREGRHVRYRLADAHVAHIVEDAVMHANEPATASG